MNSSLSGDTRYETDQEVISLDTSFRDEEMRATAGATGISIPESEVSFSFVRSGGPGGQNVNKVSTKAVLTFPVLESETLTPRQKERIIAESNRLTGQSIVIYCSETRSQAQNRKRALEILNEHLTGLLKPRIPRKATRPTRASKERRLKQKRVRSEIKHSRQERRRLDED